MCSRWLLKFHVKVCPSSFHKKVRKTDMERERQSFSGENGAPTAQQTSQRIISFCVFCKLICVVLENADA